MTEEKLLPVPVEEEMKEAIQRKLHQTPMNRHNHQDFCSKIDYCQRKIGSLTYITAIAEVAFGVSMFPRFHESIQTLVLVIIMQRTRH